MTTAAELAREAAEKLVMGLRPGERRELYDIEMAGTVEIIASAIAAALEEQQAEIARLRAALEHLGSPDMWEQVEGFISGPDCPDGHNDALIWLGGDHPNDIVAAALTREVNNAG